MRELLSRYFDACRRLIELYGGTARARAPRRRLGARTGRFDALSPNELTPRLLDELGLPFHLAVVRLEHAGRLLGEGSTDEGEALLADGREEFARPRAEPWLERVAAVETAARTGGRSTELTRS